MRELNAVEATFIVFVLGTGFGALLHFVFSCSVGLLNYIHTYRRIQLGGAQATTQTRTCRAQGSMPFTDAENGHAAPFAEKGEMSETKCTCTL